MIGIPIKRPRSIGIRSIGPDGPDRKPQLPMEGRRPFVDVGLPLFSEDFTVLRFQGSEIPEPRFQRITPYSKKCDPRHQSPANTGKGVPNRQKPEETIPPYAKKSRIASNTGDDTETGASNHQKQHKSYPHTRKTLFIAPNTCQCGKRSQHNAKDRRPNESGDGLNASDSGSQLGIRRSH